MGRALSEIMVRIAGIAIALLFCVAFVFLVEGINPAEWYPSDDFGGGSVALYYELYNDAKQSSASVYVENIDFWGRPLILLSEGNIKYIVRYGNGTLEDARERGSIVEGGLTADDYAWSGALNKGQSIQVDGFDYNESMIGMPIIFSRITVENGIEEDQILKEVVFRPDL